MEPLARGPPVPVRERAHQQRPSAAFSRFSLCQWLTRPATRESVSDGMQRAGAGSSVDRIAILGAGAWGTALAQHLASHGVPVALWARRAELAEQLLATRTNPLLPGVL